MSKSYRKNDYIKGNDKHFKRLNSKSTRRSVKTKLKSLPLNDDLEVTDDNLVNSYNICDYKEEIKHKNK